MAIAYLVKLQFVVLAEIGSKPIGHPNDDLCPGGGIGIHGGFRFRYLRVRVSPWAPDDFRKGKPIGGGRGFENR